MLRGGEIEDRVIRGISAEGGKGIGETLKNDPPKFIEVKGRLIATSDIVQLVPIYDKAKEKQEGSGFKEAF